ncbi:hypothetical protein EVAR_46787_1 [Eumeta japonica]|uniref:Uncharacterized protein n=1 Tax=Eumeta variegata TaxID=151549 RepID=A0A4C1XBC4_EUMVA|nr:hypothetical protein EVAR_46787_1 [Eumeta japonica]
MSTGKGKSRLPTELIEMSSELERVNRFDPFRSRKSIRTSPPQPVAEKHSNEGTLKCAPGSHLARLVNQAGAD